MKVGASCQRETWRHVSMDALGMGPAGFWNDTARGSNQSVAYLTNVRGEFSA
jgi:hypothetical protein